MKRLRAVGRIVAVVSLSAVAGCQQDPELPPLDIDEVRAVAGFDGLVRQVDTGQPSSGTYPPQGPCSVLTDDGAAFGDTWTSFRSVSDGGDIPSRSLSADTATVPPRAAVTQDVIGYPDVEAAQTVFARRVAAIAECVRSDVPFHGGELSRPDADTAVLINDGYALVFTARSAVLVDVSVFALPDAAQVAIEISRTIADRIA